MADESFQISDAEEPRSVSDILDIFSKWRRSKPHLSCDKEGGALNTDAGSSDVANTGDEKESPPEVTCDSCTCWTAHVTCQSCHVTLCQHCSRGHKRLPACRDHILTPVEDQSRQNSNLIQENLDKYAQNSRAFENVEAQWRTYQEFLQNQELNIEKELQHSEERCIEIVRENHARLREDLRKIHRQETERIDETLPQIQDLIVAIKHDEDHVHDVLTKANCSRFLLQGKFVTCLVDYLTNQCTELEGLLKDSKPIYCVSRLPQPPDIRPCFKDWRLHVEVLDSDQLQGSNVNNKQPCVKDISKSDNVIPNFKSDVPKTGTNSGDAKRTQDKTSNASAILNATIGKYARGNKTPLSSKSFSQTHSAKNPVSKYLTPKPFNRSQSAVTMPTNGQDSGSERTKLTQASNLADLQRKTINLIEKARGVTLSKDTASPPITEEQFKTQEKAHDQNKPMLHGADKMETIPSFSEDKIHNNINKVDDKWEPHNAKGKARLEECGVGWQITMTTENRTDSDTDERSKEAKLEEALKSKHKQMEATLQRISKAIDETNERYDKSRFQSRAKANQNISTVPISTDSSITSITEAATNEAIRGYRPLAFHAEKAINKCDTLTNQHEESKEKRQEEHFSCEGAEGLHSKLLEKRDSLIDLTESTFAGCSKNETETKPKIENETESAKILQSGNESSHDGALNGRKTTDQSKPCLNNEPTSQVDEREAKDNETKKKTFSAPQNERKTNENRCLNTAKPSPKTVPRLNYMRSLELRKSESNIPRVLKVQRSESTQSYEIISTRKTSPKTSPKNGAIPKPRLRASKTREIEEQVQETMLSKSTKPEEVSSNPDIAPLKLSNANETPNKVVVTGPMAKETEGDKKIEQPFMKPSIQPLVSLSLEEVKSEIHCSTSETTNIIETTNNAEQALSSEHISTALCPETMLKEGKAPSVEVITKWSKSNTAINIGLVFSPSEASEVSIERLEDPRIWDNRDVSNSAANPLQPKQGDSPHKEENKNAIIHTERNRMPPIKVEESTDETCTKTTEHNTNNGDSLKPLIVERTTQRYTEFKNKVPVRSQSMDTLASVLNTEHYSGGVEIKPQVKPKPKLPPKPMKKPSAPLDNTSIEKQDKCIETQMVVQKKEVSTQGLLESVELQTIEATQDKNIPISEPEIANAVKDSDPESEHDSNIRGKLLEITSRGDLNSLKRKTPGITHANLQTIQINPTNKRVSLPVTCKELLTFSTNQKQEGMFLRQQSTGANQNRENTKISANNTQPKSRTPILSFQQTNRICSGNDSAPNFSKFLKSRTNSLVLNPASPPMVPQELLRELDKRKYVPLIPPSAKDSTATSIPSFIKTTTKESDEAIYEEIAPKSELDSSILYVPILEPPKDFSDQEDCLSIHSHNSNISITQQLPQRTSLTRQLTTPECISKTTYVDPLLTALQREDSVSSNTVNPSSQSSTAEGSSNKVVSEKDSCIEIAGQKEFSGSEEYGDEDDDMSDFSSDEFDDDEEEEILNCDVINMADHENAKKTSSYPEDKVYHNVELVPILSPPPSFKQADFQNPITTRKSKTKEKKANSLSRHVKGISLSVLISSTRELSKLHNLKSENTYEDPEFVSQKSRRNSQPSMNTFPNSKSTLKLSISQTGSERDMMSSIQTNQSAICLSKLRKKRLKKQRIHQFKAESACRVLFEATTSEIWTVMESGDIHVFNTKGILLRKVSVRQTQDNPNDLNVTYEVNAICQAPPPLVGLVVASDSQRGSARTNQSGEDKLGGIFIINSDGIIQQTIAKSGYWDVTKHDTFLFAMSAKIPEQGQIVSVFHVLQPSGTLQKLRQVSLPVNYEFERLIVRDLNTVYISSIISNQILRVSLQGMSIMKYGNAISEKRTEQKGDSSKDTNYSLDTLDGPLLCMIDGDETVLVANRALDRLLVLDKNGDWSLLPVRNIREPYDCAVVTNKGKLTMYVISDYDDSLYKVKEAFI